MKAAFYTKETIRSIGMQNSELPKFGIGDTVVVSQSIKEAGKERLQAFEGDVIAIHKKGASSTFIVRKIGAHSIAVERVFPFFSPLIKEIKVLGKGDVRRAKLFYLRKKVGKAAQVKKLVETKASMAKNKASQAEVTTAQSE
jgi:large subunit ribosomal protein L19